MRIPNQSAIVMARSGAGPAFPCWVRCTNYCFDLPEFGWVICFKSCKYVCDFLAWLDPNDPF